MPNKPSAIKALRKSKKQAQRKARIGQHVKTLFKKTLALVRLGNKEEGRKAYLTFQQAVDKAAKEGVVHRNAANRKKSNLTKALA